MPDGEPGVPEDGVAADRFIFDYDPCIKIPAPGTRDTYMHIHISILEIYMRIVVYNTTLPLPSLVGGKTSRPKNWDKLLERLDETERLVYTR